MKCLKQVSAIIIMIAILANNAMAANWAVRYVHNGPTSSNVYTYTAGYVVTNNTNKVKESCTSCSNAQDLYGRIGYVTYKMKYVTSSGTVVEDISAEYSHYTTQSSHYVPISTAPANSTIYSVYTLHYFNSTAMISGKFGDF